MKRKTMLPVLLAVTMLLSSCGLGSEDPPILPESQESSSDKNSIPETEETQSEPIKIIVEDDTTAPREGMVRSRLTNEWIDAEVADLRPIAVMTPNEINAVPHYNLSNASIIYEANVEDNMTRMMAVYEDWQDLEKIGNVRSLRSYFAYWAFEWDAVIVHYGGPFFINELLELPTTQTVNGVGGDDQAFFRSSDRSTPHNAYASGEGILKVMKKKGYDTGYRGLSEEQHYRFATKADPNTLEQYGRDAKAATYIDMSGCYPLTRCYFRYNEEDGLYYRYQHLSGGNDEAHLDAVTGEQLKFKNILVQYMKYEDLGEGYLAFQCHDNTHDGYYFTNGRGIHVTWEKGSDYGATRYYDDNGNEILLNTGKTMVCIVEDDDVFTFR